jgi:twitching motility protein PilT
MAFFGRGNRNVLQQIQHSSWRDQDERTELLDQLREMSLKISDTIALLWHRDSGVRSIAVKAFMEVADISSARLLADQMVSQPSHVRGFALRIYAQLDESLTEKLVEELLRDRSSQKQKLGWDIGLSMHGAAGEKYLMRAIESGPPSMQVLALQRLIKLKEAKNVVSVLTTAARGTNERMASVAMEALVYLKNSEVLTELMIDRVAHGDATSRQMATEYLRRAAIDEPVRMQAAMLELLSEGEDATRRTAVEILLASGEPDKIIFNILMFAKDLVGWLRIRILDTLQTFGDEVLKPGMELLRHEDEQVRMAALVLFEKFDDPRLVLPVCKLLKDEDWWLRISACDTLGRLKDERAVPPLVNSLQEEEVRWAAIDALAQIASPLALKPLVQLLRDKRKEVRAEVVRAFKQFSDKRLLGLLKQVTEKDPSSEVRTLAAEVARDMAKRLNIKVENLEGNTAVISASSLKRPIDRLLAKIREEGASDLHITCGDAPFYRFKGKLVRIPGMEKLTAEQSREWIRSVLTDRNKAILDKYGELDFCYSIPEVGRYRANAFVQRHGTCATFRVIPNVPPTFADLRLPGRLTELLDYHQGLIMISGPAASGKSTTMAAIINLINEAKPSHILTLEDPIEFVHPVKTALVNQRELGSHTVSFARALRGALREDPDVIVVGELREPETISMSLEASETGHLVIATMHTTSAMSTVERIISSFPPDEQGQIRSSLSESLKYVICQSLIPRKDGDGRVAVFEILKNTFNVGNTIRENKLHLIPSLMQIGRSVGMQTVDNALADLVESELISPEQAWMRADKQENFEALCDPEFIRKTKSLL